ncbi:hypothetical protein CDAR_491411 [Caerostris darwini]|uniref:Uncharacterized protein n=1 Tax=Caerostris darwini TaxID=1538125 RepID=A0AAV4X8M9_9ARAC|nr:hypothetical protein CDAR_491411 [Caerostris darwini]
MILCTETLQSCSTKISHKQIRILQMKLFTRTRRIKSRTIRCFPRARHHKANIDLPKSGPGLIFPKRRAAGLTDPPGKLPSPRKMGRANFEVVRVLAVSCLSVRTVSEFGW